MNARRSILAAFVAAATVLSLPAQVAVADDRSIGERVDDTTLAARVKAALVEAKNVPSMKVEVEVRDGVVQLSGFVDSPLQADAAVAAARGVSGVRSVTSSIQVQTGDRTLGERIDDTTLAARVKAALVESKEASALNVQVEVRDGVVQLSGFADNRRKADAAVLAAQQVSGVRSVIDAIQLAPVR